MHFSPESGDKLTRATPLASQINAGAVQMLKGGWNQQFIDECRLFPNGKYDDQVDGAARAFNALLRPQAEVFVQKDPRSDSNITSSRRTKWSEIRRMTGESPSLRAAT